MTPAETTTFIESSSNGDELILYCAGCGLRARLALPMRAMTFAIAGRGFIEKHRRCSGADSEPAR
jgi:hypothetical protein